LARGWAFSVASDSEEDESSADCRRSAAVCIDTLRLRAAFLPAASSAGFSAFIELEAYRREPGATKREAGGLWPAAAEDIKVRALALRRADREEKVCRRTAAGNGLVGAVLAEKWRTGEQQASLRCEFLLQCMD